MKPLKLSLSLWTSLLIMLCAIAVASAHAGTGTPRFTNEDIGPYRLFVWSDPDPAQVGEYHVAVALTESVSGDSNGFAGEPVLNADITVTMTHAESDQILTEKATHEEAVNQIYYEAAFDLPATGNWLVELLIDGPGGQAEASYSEVVAAATFNWMPIAGGILAVLLVIGAFFFHTRVGVKPKEVAS